MCSLDPEAETWVEKKKGIYWTKWCSCSKELNSGSAGDRLRSWGGNSGPRGTRWSVRRCPRCCWSCLIEVNLDLWRWAEQAGLIQGKTTSYTKSFSTRVSLKLRPTGTGEIFLQQARGEQGFSADADCQRAAGENRHQPWQVRGSPAQPLTAALIHQTDRELQEHRKTQQKGQNYNVWYHSLF